jgi:hypothetical protein
VINEDCSKRAHKKLAIPFETTKKCVANSFSQPKGWGKAEVYNTKIDNEIAYWKQYGTNIYPSVVINKKTYRGQIEPLSVYNAICAGFTEPPDQCLKTLHRKKEGTTEITIEDDDDVSVGAIVAAVFAIIIVNVVIVYCCRRKAKREMANEMQF